MKVFHKSIIPLLAVLLGIAVPMTAQQEDGKDKNSKVIIITKTIDEEGNEVVEKMVKEGAEAEAFAEENEFTFETDDADEVEVHILKDIEEDIDIDIDGNAGTKRIRINGVDENGETFELEWEGEGDIPKDIQEKIDALENQGAKTAQKRIIKKRHYHDPDKAFLGVMIGKNVEVINGVETITGASDLGIVVNDVVEGSAAAVAGLQSEDIITAIDGQPTKSMEDLTNILKNHKPGDKIKITYLRGDQSNKVKATLLPR